MTNNILKKYEITAKKSLGQNFLIHEGTLESIIQITDISWKNVIEVWPWYGALTEKIITQKPNKLTLVELDADMVEVLRERGVGEYADILHQDVLTYTPEVSDYTIIANIPYYITSPILRHFIYDVSNTPDEMIILMQSDVAEKIISEKSSVLSLYIKKKYNVTHKISVSREYFSPKPKVESSVVYFQKHDDFLDVDDWVFLRVIKAWFSSPRKKLIKNLTQAGYTKEKILDFFSVHNISPDIRAERISIEKWNQLCMSI